jgi:L,D-transpeptidase ErfK/SrfK
VRATVFLLAVCAGLSSADSTSAVKPSSARAPHVLSAYHIRISVKDCKLRLYEAERLVAEYPVATAQPGIPSPEGEGRIAAVIFKPSWHPMPRTRAAYKARGIDLPADIPYGHPYHMMGSFKMVLTNKSSRYAIPGAYAIHGTPNEASVGKRASGGCFRMKKADGEPLAHRMEAELKAGREILVSIDAKT